MFMSIVSINSFTVLSLSVAFAPFHLVSYIHAISIFRLVMVLVGYPLFPVIVFIIAKCSLLCRYLSLFCYVKHIIAKKCRPSNVPKTITLRGSPSLYKSPFVRRSSATTSHISTNNDLIQSTTVSKIGWFETHHCTIRYAIYITIGGVSPESVLKI